jgi:hypothetical protein
MSDFIHLIFCNNCYSLILISMFFSQYQGLSFSSLMYVTRRSMENAVADLTKKLQHASDVIDVGVHLLHWIFFQYFKFLVRHTHSYEQQGFEHDCIINSYI